MNIIDRRLNPKGKSLANRQRLFRRARQEIQKAVRDASAARSVSDVGRGEKIVIPADVLREPTFRRTSEGGVREHVLPGNKEFVRGDHIPKPPRGAAGAAGSEGATDGDGEDDFRFAMTKDEFLDVFLDDLELPDLAKKSVTQSEIAAPVRCGFSISGSPRNINLVRTMRNSLSRRIALGRPNAVTLHALEDELRDLAEAGEDSGRRKKLEARLEEFRVRVRRVPYIDPVDLRYNRFEPVPKPVARAVMFCLMDVSGSMSEQMKDLAKRFFMLLYIFLTRCYRHVEIVFIRHTHEAAEVDEKTFFYAGDTGGTVVSTALAEMKRVIDRRYPPAEWNIYAAQASDGDNAENDDPRALYLVETVILPLCQYFAYIEVGEESDGDPKRQSGLWRAYATAARAGALAMRKVRTRNEIFAVFRELFARDRKAA